MLHRFGPVFTVALFVLFGAKLLKDGFEMEGGKPSEELCEVENELSKVGKKTDPESADSSVDSVAEEGYWRSDTVSIMHCMQHITY
jgi:hypothetical protein